VAKKAEGPLALLRALRNWPVEKRTFYFSALLRYTQFICKITFKHHCKQYLKWDWNLGLQY